MATERELTQGSALILPTRAPLSTPPPQHPPPLRQPGPAGGVGGGRGDPGLSDTSCFITFIFERALVALITLDRWSPACRSLATVTPRGRGGGSIHRFIISATQHLIFVKSTLLIVKFAFVYFYLTKLSFALFDELNRRQFKLNYSRKSNLVIAPFPRGLLGVNLGSLSALTDSLFRRK